MFDDNLVEANARHTAHEGIKVCEKHSGRVLGMLGFERNKHLYVKL